MKIPTWSVLSALRTTGIFKIGYAGVISVPVYSHFIVFLEQDLPPLGNALPHLATGPFLLFLGSVLLAAAHVLNETACPDLVKEHRTLHNYRLHLANCMPLQSIIDDKLSHIKEQLERSAELDLKKAFPNVAIPVEDVKRVTAAVTDKVMMLNDKVYSDSLRGELRDYETIWQREEEWCAPLRFSISVLYAASAVMLLYLTANQVVTVLDARF